MPTSNKNSFPKKHKLTPIQSLTAGVVAGAVEATLTYPTEFVKTQLQLQKSQKQGQAKLFNGPVDCIVKTTKTKGICALYSGLPAMLTGNAVKAGVRFLTYDSVKNMLKGADGQLTGPRYIVAGLCAGMVEAVVAVAPTEAIKTKLINDRISSTPKYNGAIDCARRVIQTEGLGGLYRGVGAVIGRQGANSAIRFTTYDLLKKLAQNHRSDPEAPLPPTYTFSIGMAAGIITCYATMPFDVIKTRMQGSSTLSKTGGIEGAYRNSVHCGWSILRDEGVSALWKGTTPRLARLMFSGAIVFTVYEQVIKLF